MTRYNSFQLSTVLRVSSGVVLVLVLAGHTATLVCSYHWGTTGQEEEDGGSFGWQLLLGGAALWSVLLLLALGFLVPEATSSWGKAWLAVHLTWSDDAAACAVHALHNFQVHPLLDALRPVMDVLGFTLPATLAFWWWSLQGLLLVALVTYITREEDSPTVDDEGNEDMMVVVGCPRRAEEMCLDMPDILDLCCNTRSPDTLLLV